MSSSKGSTDKTDFERDSHSQSAEAAWGAFGKICLLLHISLLVRVK